jgi:hypothetical protein
MVDTTVLRYVHLALAYILIFSALISLTCNCTSVKAVALFALLALNIATIAKTGDLLSKWALDGSVTGNFNFSKLLSIADQDFTEVLVFVGANLVGY